MPSPLVPEPQDASLRAIVDDTLAQLLVDRPGDEQLLRRRAVQSLFDDREDGPGPDGDRCALCGGSLGRCPPPIVPGERPGSGEPPAFLVWDVARPGSVCGACVATDFFTRDADVAATLQVLDEPTADFDVARARFDLRKRFEGRTVTTRPAADCAFCVEDGPAAQGRGLTVGRLCLGAMRRARETPAAPLDPAQRARVAAAEAEEAAARAAARERRRRAAEAPRLTAELEARRAAAEARRIARLPAWRQREEDALHRARNPPARYGLWGSAFEEDQAAGLDADTFRGPPSFPDELRVEARRVAARARALRARLLGPAPPEDAPPDEAERQIAALEREALNGFRLQNQERQRGRNVVCSFRSWGYAQSFLEKYRLGPALRERLDEALWLLQRPLALGVRYHEDNPNKTGELDEPVYDDVTWHYLTLVRQLHDYRAPLAGQVQKGGLVLHGGSDAERQAIAAEVHLRRHGADACANARFAVVGPADDEGPLAPSLARETVYVRDLLALSPFEQRLLAARLAEHPPTILGTDDLTRFVARAGAELEPAVAQAVLALPRYDLAAER
jgi:hypothetical protein